MATKRMRSSGRWEFIVKRKGLLPAPLYLTFESELEGDAYCTRLEALLDRGIVPPDLVKAAPGKHTTVGTLIDDYLNVVAVPPSDRAYLVPVRARFADKPVVECSYAWAETWITTMKRVDRLSPSTMRHYVGATARCFDWACRRDTALFPAGNPLRQLPRRYARYNEADGEKREDVERDRRLSPDEDVRITALLSGDMRRCYVLAKETAMRMREIYTLTADQVDTAKRTVFLDKTKNGSKRQVPLSGPSLRALAGIAGSGLIFPWWDGTPETLDATTAKLSRQFANVFKAAGCGDLTFHDLRHSAICQFYLRTKLSDVQIALISGHKDLRMLKRYSNLRGSELSAHLW